MDTKLLDTDHHMGMDMMDVDYLWVTCKYSSSYINLAIQSYLSYSWSSSDRPSLTFCICETVLTSLSLIRFNRLYRPKHKTDHMCCLGC